MGVSRDSFKEREKLDLGRLRKNKDDILITLAGVPNVGKSTVFNALTGMHQHTGNWTGKTVGCTVGSFERRGRAFTAADIPGTYSLYTRSAEEEQARDFLLGAAADVTVVVCDATSLERSLRLVLQILEITPRTAVFVNLCDEAKKKNISVDFEKLEKILGVPVVAGAARSKRGINTLVERCVKITEAKTVRNTYITRYQNGAEEAIASLEAEGLSRYEAAGRVYLDPASFGFENETALRDSMAAAFVSSSEEICRECVSERASPRICRERLLDRLFTSRATGFPVMALLLLLIFWLTLKGANYPSEALWRLLFSLGEKLRGVLCAVGCPGALCAFLTDGVYKVTAWIVSVMLPPMAIFFPLFTFMEDFGYLPRVAFNLDRCFKKCGGCGKQALCMCMGLGYNAVGVTGCRIIDSKRERMIAVLTNSFVPCNGRFPAILTLITVFFVSSSGGVFGSELVPAAVMTLLIVLSAGATLAASKLLSSTILKGTPSSFTLELPPYRVPKLFETITRSVLDRTLFVLGRAVTVAAPAGAVIWLLANISISNVTLLSRVSSALEPVGALMGLDGVILLAFILALPANEIMLPVIIMAYMASGTLTEITDISFVRDVLVSNGWGLDTAVCTIVFSLFHWPCSTTLLTIKKETGSFCWTLFAAALPTAVGAVLCIFINLLFRAFAL